MASEVVWNNGAATSASGGGVSAFFPVRRSQSGAGINPVSANPPNNPGRGPPTYARSWILWRAVGQLSIDKAGDLVFPPVAAVPGIYRFMIEDGTGVVAGYIGQAAKSLARRFSLYRSRGRRPSYPLEKKTTSRNACRLISELAAGHAVHVDLLDERVTCPDGRVYVLDLVDKAFRSSLERRLILKLCETGIEVLNRNYHPQWKAGP